MTSKLLLPALLAASLFPLSASAEDIGLFGGLDLSGGVASGSSDTTNGGNPVAGGGIVENVEFGNTVGIGGHVGYRFDPVWSAFLSYQHVRGDVSWDAVFPLFGVTSNFDGTAISNVVLANLAYDFALSGKTSIQTVAGAGLSFNSLSDVSETDVGTGIFLADVEDNTEVSPAAQIGAGLQHRIMPNAMLGLAALVSYTGGFETGDTRRGNAGTTPIGPYKIDDVWRTQISASMRFTF